MSKNIHACSAAAVKSLELEGLKQDPEQHCMHECFCSSRAAGSVTYWFSESIQRVVFQPLLHLGLRDLGVLALGTLGVGGFGAFRGF